MGIAAVFDASAVAAILAIPIALRLRAETAGFAIIGLTPPTQR
jgi:hypothetical protein